MTCNFIDWLSFILVILGGINWGLVGLFEYNVVAAIFGEFAPAIYILVGFAAVYSLYSGWKVGRLNPRFQ